MTLGELNGHYELRQRLAKAQELLYALRASAAPGAQALTGMPHGTGVRDKVGDLAVEIAEAETDLTLLQKEIETQERTVLSFIGTISDLQTRMVFRLRFIRGLTWGEVAEVVGGRNTEDSVKSLCYRHLKSCRALTRRDA